MTIGALFDRLLSMDGSDLHLTPGYPPMLRVRGKLQADGDRPLTSQDIEGLIYPLLAPSQRKQFQATGDLDFAHAHGTRSRFRANYLRKTTGVGAVFRAIPVKVKTLDELHVPPGVRKLAEVRSGLVLVTGPTGSGKSTTLAAMIDHINRTRQVHIRTIEDPVEFVHQPRLAQITHKEVGMHVPTFLDAIRSAGRENADVILVGELRGAETMRLALQLASFGILILATVHTNSAPATIDRIVNSFPADEQAPVRGMLAESLAGIVAQQLVPTADGKSRVAAHEILVGTSAVLAMIRDNKIFQVPSVMQAGQSQGMQTMDMALERLVAEKKVSPTIALEKAIDKESFQKTLAALGAP